MPTSRHLLLVLACVFEATAASACHAGTPAETRPQARQDGKQASPKEKPPKKLAPRAGKPAPPAAPARAQDGEEVEQQPASPKPPVRRAVPAVIESVTPARPPVYGPVLTPLPAPAGTQRPNPGVPAPSLPSGPPVLNSCDAGGCTDTSGGRFNGGVGTTLIGPQGQACVRGAAGIQCH